MNEFVSSVIAFAIGGIAYIALIVILKNKRKRRGTAEIIEEMWARMNKQDKGGKEMTKAEEKAIDAWAIYEYREHPKGLYHTCFVDGYQQGYEQAEKDLELTIDDIEKIHTFLYAIKNNKQGTFTFTRLSDEQYQEVLRRFNKAKEEQK